jgi:hypothetical protein
MFTLAVNLRGVEAPSETKIFITPSCVLDCALVPGGSFRVEVKVADVEHLYCWQVNIIFDPTVLEVVYVTEGDFLKEQPRGTTGLVSRIENALGWVLLGCSTLGAHDGKSGSGTLATAEFQILAVGESSIEIAEADPIKGLIYTLLIGNTTHAYMFDILFSTENGYFSNLAPPSIHELIETIENWHLPRGTERSLTTKLKTAGLMLDMEKEDGAIRKLNTLINGVQMLEDKTLTEEQAIYLMVETQRIIDLIQD